MCKKNCTDCDCLSAKGCILKGEDIEKRDNQMVFETRNKDGKDRSRNSSSTHGD